MGNSDALLFRPLAVVGAVYVATLAFRLLAHLALLLRRPTDLRRRYGAWAVVTGPTSGIGRSMAVVNIGSGTGCIEALPSFPLYAVYTASKGYVAQFSRSLYVEYRSKGIDVQCQAPMFVETKMTSDITARRSRL